MCSINRRWNDGRTNSPENRKDDESRSAERQRNEERGFALIAALMALWVLTALGVLVFSVTTQDIRISSRTLGEKKAFLAAESGVAWLSQNFDPANPAAVASRVVDAAAADQNSTFAVSAATTPASGPAALPSPGFEIGGGQVWGQTRWEAVVTGRNSNYNSRIDIETGIGYGPVDITTLYR
jgi:Tfp pilus assembly protein PilX